MNATNTSPKGLTNFETATTRLIGLYNYKCEMNNYYCEFILCNLENLSEKFHHWQKAHPMPIEPKN